MAKVEMMDPMTEEEFERRQNLTHYSGIAAGLDQAARLVMDSAAKYFRCVDADASRKAELLRDVSLRITAKTNEAEKFTDQFRDGERVGK